MPPLDTRDHEPFWGARMTMTPEEARRLREEAEQAARAGYAATTRAIARGGEAAQHLAGEAGAAVDKFKVGVQAEMDKALGPVAEAGERIRYRAVGQGPEEPRSGNPVARWAESHVGRGGYGRIEPAPDAQGRFQDQLPRGLRGMTAPKCNQFVWDALSGGRVPAGRVEGERIPTTKDWGDPSSKIGGYAPVTGAPQPGDVVSNGHHVGIYAPLADGRPGTVSAASPGSADGGFDGGVVHNAWGFREDDGPIVIWRPVASPRR